MSSVRAVGLRCEYRTEEVCVGAGRPRLSWRLEALDAATRDLKQRAYQIQVGTSQHAADVWDSGMVESAATAQIEYGGPELLSEQICWWRVRAWDQLDRPSEWSEPANWSVGLLKASDWVAQWIGYDAPVDGEQGDVKPSPSLSGAHWIGTGEGAVAATIFSEPAKSAVYFRKVFEIPSGRKVASAVVMMTAEDGFEFYLNAVSRGGMVAKTKAKGIDVTPFVRTGKNVLAVAVRKYDPGAAALVGKLVVQFDGGGEMIVDTDPSWLWSRNGSGWEREGTDVSAWQPAHGLNRAGEAGRPTPQDVPLHLPPPPCLRKTFTATRQVRRATLYASALGAYQLWLNGREVTPDVLGPGWTEYSRRVHYRAYDVTHLIAPGKNAIGALLGDGWFAAYYSYQGKRNLYGGEPRLLLQLNLTYADGSHEVIATDATWRATYGPWREADMLMGARYDARHAQPSWLEPTFADSAWNPADVQPARLSDESGALVWTFSPQEQRLSPSGVELERAAQNPSHIRRLEFSPHPGAPVRRHEEVLAKSMTEVRPGVWVFDLGQNIVGWVKLRVRSHPSVPIEIRHAEILNPDGTLYETNLRAARAMDVFIPSGAPEETFEPVFTFHGFRYVSVSGMTTMPDLDTVTGVVVHTDLPRTGTFECSNDRVNGLVHNILWGQKGNHLEIPTDCPQRDERLGWTGDAQFFMRTGAYMMDVAAFFTKWLVDLIDDAQYADGSFGSVAPDQNVGHGNTAWDDAAIICPWTLYRAYGDTRVIERHWNRLTKYIDFLQVTSKDYIRGAGAYGDWVNLGGGAKSEVMGTAYSEHVTRLMSKMARAVGKIEDARKYELLADAIRAAFIRAFVTADGAILESSQTGYALAFTMDLLPVQLRTKAAEKFVAQIEKTGWHLGTGFIGTPRLLPALSAAGRTDIAYRLLTNETFPSWLYQVKLGATTMWERWDGWTPEKGFQDPGMNSFNHYAFGSVGEWLFGTIAGIETIEPGFNQFRIAPQPGGGLTWAKAAYDSIHGRISSQWKIENGAFSLEVTVPANTSAVVDLPDGTTQEVGSGAYQFSCRV